MAGEYAEKRYEMQLQCRRCRSKAIPFLLELYVVGDVVHITVQCSKDRCKHQSTFTLQSLIQDVHNVQKSEKLLEERQKTLGKRAEKTCLAEELASKKAKEKLGRY